MPNKLNKALYFPDNVSTFADSSNTPSMQRITVRSSPNSATLPTMQLAPDKQQTSQPTAQSTTGNKSRK